MKGKRRNMITMMRGLEPKEGIGKIKVTERILGTRSETGEIEGEDVLLALLGGVKNSQE